MMEIEVFDKDIMSHATYYETICYVADYVQRLLEEIFEGEEIEFPVPIEKILEKLEIRLKTVKCLDGAYPLTRGGCSFNKREKIIFSYPNSQISENYKVKCVSRFLVHYKDYLKGKSVLEFDYIKPEDGKRVEPCDGIVDMIAWQIMLPWKQAIVHLTEIQRGQGGPEYYYLLHTIEAKEQLGKISQEEIKKVYFAIEEVRHD